MFRTHKSSRNDMHEDKHIFLRNMIDLNTKDDKEMIVKSTLQSTAVLELNQILDIRGPKIPSWGN